MSFNTKNQTKHAGPDKNKQWFFFNLKKKSYLGLFRVIHQQRSYFGLNLYFKVRTPQPAVWRELRDDQP